MNVFLAECIGTAILLILGNGVVANVVLKKTWRHWKSLPSILPNWGCRLLTRSSSRDGWKNLVHSSLVVRLNPARD